MSKWREGAVILIGVLMAGSQVIGYFVGIPVNSLLLGGGIGLLTGGTALLGKVAGPANAAK